MFVENSVSLQKPPEPIFGKQHMVYRDRQASQFVAPASSVRRLGKKPALCSTLWPALFWLAVAPAPGTIWIEATQAAFLGEQVEGVGAFGNFCWAGSRFSL